MRKVTALFTVFFLLSLIAVPVNQADVVNFAVSATVPAANGVSILATEVDAQTGVFGNQVQELDFDPLAFDAQNGIYLPDHFFAIDVAATGGAGAPDVTVTYTEGSKPVGQVKGLGFKSTSTFVKVTGAVGNQTETELVAHGPKKLLKDLAGGEVINDLEILGGFLRVYVGVFPGDDQTIIDQGGEPFTNGDAPGAYTGTLTITATVS